MKPGELSLKVECKSMYKLNITTVGLLMSLLFSCSSGEEYYVKHVAFPENATIEQKIDMASRLIPSSQQLEWQKMEQIAFLHFGMNTYHKRDWGTGKEDPDIFNPIDFDAEQWVKILKETGFRMVIITAKHHDGFCLWPTKTTKHSVVSSKWKNGKGDVIKELRDACYKYDMKFGVYLSPWDRNAMCYGDSPVYNKFFIEQLTELLTNYGEVHEVWFDGANGEGPNGKKQVYDWDAYMSVITKLQPNAVKAIMGDDIRWVGNEKGIGHETEWSASVITPAIYERASENNKLIGLDGKVNDVSGREMLMKAKELFWYPSEVDVSIRPQWFYNEDQDKKVKSLKNLVDIYFQSVGRNSVLLLNVPPDTKGLINNADINRLKEFKKYIDETFDDNKIVDGERLWKANVGEERIYNLKSKTNINVLMLQEDISKGQRVENVEIDVMIDGEWKNIIKGTTIGYKRLFRFNEVNTDRVRVTITGSRRTANICNVAAFYAQPLKDDSVVSDWNNMPRNMWKVISKNPLIIDLGKKVTLKSFAYAPLNAEAKPNMAFKYSFSASLDGKKWDKLYSDMEFSNIIYNPIPQKIRLGKKVETRYICLDALSINGSAAEIDINEIGIDID